MAEVVADAQPSSSYAPQPFHFTGRAGEYFGIWIVNLLLTIVTLGIYSPWAKVRRLKYFHRHTEVAGSTFDFHGSPIRILIGRLIALAILLAYNFTARMQSPLVLVVLVVIAVVMPALLRNSLRFRLYNTSWRSTRFHFRGSVGGAYRVFLLNGFLTLITLYTLAPFTHQRIKAYQHNNTYLGTTPFSFHARAGQFYKTYSILLGAIVILIFAVILSGVGAALATAGQAQKGGPPANPKALISAFLLIYGVAILLAVSIGPLFQALITNLIWSNTRIGAHRLVSHIHPGRFIWIAATNLLAVVFTLGLMIPWASVRLARYQLSVMQLLPASDLQEFAAGDPETIGAFGEEATSIFDLDVAL